LFEFFYKQNLEEYVTINVRIGSVEINNEK